MLISTLKWPELATTQPSFMTLKCASSITCLSPVAETMKSDCAAASTIGITRYPSITASRARSESTSVTMTLAPAPRARMAMPLPHQP